MKKIKIEVDSIIDIITNSSTEIFTFPSSNAPDLIKKIVNDILKEAGANKSFDDLYEIEYTTNSRKEDDFVYWVSDKKDKYITNKTKKYVTIEDARAFLKLNADTREKWFKEWEATVDYDGFAVSENPKYRDNIVLVNKSGQSTELTKMIEKVFDSEEISN